MKYLVLAIFVLAALAFLLRFLAQINRELSPRRARRPTRRQAPELTELDAPIHSKLLSWPEDDICARRGR